MHVSAPFSALYRRVQYFSAPGRCVVKMHAVSGSAVKRFFRTCASVFSSSAEVASSRSKIGAPAQHRAGDSNALRLPLGKPAAMLRDLRVHAVWQR